MMFLRSPITIMRSHKFLDRIWMMHFHHTILLGFAGWLRDWGLRRRRYGGGKMMRKLRGGWWGRMVKRKRLVVSVRIRVAIFRGLLLWRRTHRFESLSYPLLFSRILFLLLLDSALPRL
jgi:hypothetical protein